MLDTSRPNRDYAAQLLAQLRPASICERDGKYLNLSICGTIGEDVRAGAVADALNAHADAKVIQVIVDSPGGLVADAERIHWALRRHGGHVVTTAGRKVASAAVHVFLAGDERLAKPYSRFLIHGAAMEGTPDRGRWTAEAHASALAHLRITNARLVEAFIARTGGRRSFFETAIAGEKWFGPDVAEEQGLVHGLSSGRSAMHKGCQRSHVMMVWGCYEGEQPPAHVARRLGR